MMKELKVIEPFFNLEVGDKLTLTEDGKSYVFTDNDSSVDKTESGDSKFSFSATFKIDSVYAQELIKNGYLEEVDYKKNDTFRNVFDEIDIMLNRYNEELDNLDRDFDDKPACLKVEKGTVLKNLIKALSHLRELKK